jgi:hypothetical protein
MNRLILLAPFALASATFAQDSIDPFHKYAWSENIGWTNWGAALAPSHVQIHASFLSGFVWTENAGWINLGDGTPANTVSYANLNGTDFGVNLAAGSGNLTGLAWGENIGWINFAGGALATPPRTARFDAIAHRFYGLAWGENVGWLNLDDANHYVGTSCPADFNCDGSVDFFDYDDFVVAFEDGPLPACRTSADFNNDGSVDFFDYDDFVLAFEAGC